MNEKLPHAVVLDLLPVYIDGLTHEATSCLIEEHLSQCPSCRQTYEDMISENVIVQAPSEQIDYLKKIRKKSKRNVLIAVVVTFVLIVSGIGLHLYVLGKPADPQYLSTYVTLNGDKITIGGQDTKEGEGIGRLRWQRTGNVLKATVYETKNGKSDFQYMIDQENVDQIWLNGLIEMDQGTRIKKSIARLYSMRTAEGNDQKEIEHLVTYASIIEKCTSSFKDGTLTVTIKEQEYPVSWPKDSREALEQLSLRLLALVENVHRIVWIEDGKETVYDAGDFPKIKEAYAHPHILQEMLEDRQKKTSSFHTLSLSYAPIEKATFTIVTLYQDGRRVYESGSPYVTMNSMQTSLPDGTYEAQVEVELEGKTLQTKRIPIKWTKEKENARIDIAQEGAALKAEVRE